MTPIELAWCILTLRPLCFGSEKYLNLTREVKKTLDQFLDNLIRAQKKQQRWTCLKKKLIRAMKKNPARSFNFISPEINGVF